MHREPAAAGVHLERELAAVRHDLAEVELDGCCCRAPRRRAGRARRGRPLGERTVMSAMAGPAFGLTSSITESWVAPAPTAGEPLVGHRRRAVDRGERGRLRAAGDQAGREVVGAGDHRRAEPRRCGRDPAGAHRAAVRPTSRARPGRRPTPSPPGPRRGCSRRAGPTRCRAGRPGRPPTRTVSGVSTGAFPCGSPRSGCRSSSASAQTTGSTHRQDHVGPEPAPHRRPPSRSRSVDGAHSTSTTRIASPCRTSSPTRSHERGPSRSLAERGRSDLPGAGAAVLGAGLLQPGGRVERGRHLAVGGRRQHDVLDAARGQRRHRVRGRPGRPAPAPGT